MAIRNTNATTLSSHLAPGASSAPQGDSAGDSGCVPLLLLSARARTRQRLTKAQTHQTPLYLALLKPCSSSSDPGLTPHKTEFSRFGSPHFWERSKPQILSFPTLRVGEQDLAAPPPARGAKSLARMGGLCAENLQSRKNRTGEGWAGKSLSCYKASGVDQPTPRCWEEPWGEVAPGLELSMAVAGSGFAGKKGVPSCTNAASSSPG